MDISARIAQLNKQILEAKLAQPSDFKKIRALQQELDKLHEDKSNPN
jgi:hypothetical protein